MTVWFKNFGKHHDTKKMSRQWLMKKNKTSCARQHFSDIRYEFRKIVVHLSHDDHTNVPYRQCHSPSPGCEVEFIRPGNIDVYKMKSKNLYDTKARANTRAFFLTINLRSHAL